MSSLVSLANNFLSLAKQELNKQHFNAIRTLPGRLQYLGELDLPYVAAGTSRYVFVLNSESKKALKLAMNLAGVAQNRAEYELLTSAPGKYFPKFYDKAPDDSWIEVELVKPITSDQELQSLLGINEEALKKLGIEIANKFKDFQSFYNYKIKMFAKVYDSLIESNADNNFIDEVNESMAELKSYSDNFRLVDFINEILKSSVPLEEACRMVNLGKNAAGQIVVLDGGLTHEIFENFYRRDFEVEEDDMADPFEDFVYPISSESLGPAKPFTSKDPRNVMPAPEKIRNSIQEQVEFALISNTLDPVFKAIDMIHRHMEAGSLSEDDYDIYTTKLVRQQNRILKGNKKQL